MKTGIQISSLKPLLLTSGQVREACARIAAMDGGAVQLQWIDPAVPIGDIAAAMEENGLISLGTQDFYQVVEQNEEYYVNLNAATGGRWLTVSRIPEVCKSREGLDRFVSRLRAMQARLEPLGQVLCFHPVTADFQAVPGMDAVEYLLQAMPELQLCLDLFHLNRNCRNMPAFIRRYAGRIPMVHFKDSDPAGKLVPAGQGTVSWQGVVQACLDAGVCWGLAEQESWDRDPYDCLGEALAWLGRELNQS